MTVLAQSHRAQLTLDLEPGLADRHPTVLDCLRSAVYSSPKPLKSVAADMDLSASELSRKLSGNPDDPRRFTVEDLERYVAGTGDTTPVLYLAVKYLQSDEARRAGTLSQAANLLRQLAPLVEALQKAGP